MSCPWYRFWTWVVQFVVFLLEVHKVFTQDRVRLLLRSTSLTTLQFEVEYLEVFKVYTQDRARYSVLWSRSLTFQFQVVSVMIFVSPGELFQ